MSGKRRKKNKKNFDKSNENEVLNHILEQNETNKNLNNSEQEIENNEEEIENNDEEMLINNDEILNENKTEENENKTNNEINKNNSENILKNEELKEKANSIPNEETSSKTINSLDNNSILKNFEIINENDENKSIDEISFVRELYKNINYKIIMKAIDDELEITIKNINMKPFPEYYSKFKLNELQKINYFKLFNTIKELLYELKILLQESFIKINETNQILFTIPINMRIIDKVQFNIKEIEKTLEEKNSLMEKYILYLEEKIINFQSDLDNNKLNDKEKIILNLNHKIQNLEKINLLLNDNLENQKKKIEELSKLNK